MDIASAPNVFKPLTQFQQRVLDWLRSKRHLAHGICHATATIARLFGVSESYVRKTLRVLLNRGHITREWDYGLRTRRRIRLPDQAVEPTLFPDAPEGDVAPPAPDLMTGQESRQSRDNSPVTTGVPPDPPIAGPGGEDSQAAGATPPPHQVAALIRQAERTVPSDPSVGRRVANLLGRWRPDWVAAALDRLDSKVRRHAVPSPVGYVVGVLRGFERDGGPAPRARLVSIPLDPAERAAAEADFVARFEAMRAARSAGGARW